MSGNTNLPEVLRTLTVSCDEIRYGFATTNDRAKLSVADVLCMFREAEGLTIVADTNYLEQAGIEYEGPYAKLTIEVHTSLELVGLTAALAKALTDEGISANVVAAYYHDHIFVAYDKRSDAIQALLQLKTSAG